MRNGRGTGRRWRLLPALVPAGVAGLPAAGGNAVTAEPPAYLTLEASHGVGTVANGWERVDHYLDTTSGFRAEGYPSDGRGDHHDRQPP
ncbi:hypothetical protein [Streptomyces sp. NPDC001880]